VCALGRAAAWGASRRGLLSPGERKNGWQIAAVHGDDTPDGVPQLLGRAVGDAEAGRDAWRCDGLEPLGTPQGGGVIDETGLLHKGRHAAGGARP
jgi:SRSO17 transposase